MYVDVHCHLTYKDYDLIMNELFVKLESEGFKAIVVNGLDHSSNRKIMDLAKKYEILKPSLGIYPLNAAFEYCKKLPFEVPFIDIEEELTYIRKKAEEGSLSAIGECGLDGYWLEDSSFLTQEKIFIRLIEIAVENDLPIIIHSRKLEKRVFDILSEYSHEKVVFHCYGGKVKLATQMIEKHNWNFSIPAISRRNEAFCKMLKEFPLDNLLTETDSPYLPPIKGDLNTPLSVMETVDHFAHLRNIPLSLAKSTIYKNYERIFISGA